MRLHLRAQLWGFPLSLLLAAACSSEGPAPESEIESTSSALTTAEKQAKVNAFYDPSNQITIRIKMSSAEWEVRNPIDDIAKNKLPAEYPRNSATTRGEQCADDVRAYTGSRFDWRLADEVTIETSKFPLVNSSFTLQRVAMKKKSWCGSFSTTKPSFHLDYNQDDVPGRDFKNNEDAIESRIGTSHLMLNNSIQDPELVRQCLDARLFKEAGLPAPRCNFANVYVNNTFVGTYVNLEPPKKRFIQNNFNGNDKGNLYELGPGDDLKPSHVSRISFEGYSDYADKKDLTLATSQIAAGDYASVIDSNQFLKAWAMEILLKHWDGHTMGPNNTYIYNDVTAVANPGVDQVNFKFIPWGVDQTLQKNRPWYLYDNAILTKTNLRGTSLRDELYRQLDSVFSTSNLDNNIIPFVRSLATAANALLANAGAAQIPAAKIDSLIADGLKKIRPSIDVFYDIPVKLVGYNGECLHREPNVSVGTEQWAIDHKPCGTSERYKFSLQASGSRPGYYRITWKEAGASYTYGTRADKSHTLPNGAYDVYYGRVGNSTDSPQYWRLVPESNSPRYQIRNAETDQCMHYSTAEKNSAGNYEVYVSSCDQAEKKLFSIVPWN